MSSFNFDIIILFNNRCFPILGEVLNKIFQNNFVKLEYNPEAYICKFLFKSLNTGHNYNFSSKLGCL